MAQKQDDNSSRMGVLKETVKEFSADECPRMAAAMAYYTIFALPPLLILVILIAGFFVSPEQIQGNIEAQMQSALGQQGAEQITTMIEQANRPDTGGIIPILLSVGALVFSATGAFFQLQKALNKAWEVEPDPERGGVKDMIMKRLLSLLMIVFLAVLVIAAILLSTILSAFGDIISEFLPGVVSQYFLMAVNLALTLGIFTLVFAAIFKILPDAKVQWKDVWLGSFVTAVLLTITGFAMSIYLGRSNPGSAYGAAGSLAVILIWVYIASMILFLGAEFTQVRARRRGKYIMPKEGAVKVKEEKHFFREGGEQPA